MSMFGHYAHRGGAPTRRLGVACLLALVACSAEPGSGRSLGTDLGTFGVQASESESDCGPGALGSTPELAFDVELVRADTELFWDGRVGGSIDARLAFEVAASARFELRAPSGADPGCAIERQDTISGVLRADAGGTIIGFTAEMRFAFSAEPNATCTPRELGEAELPNLPCSMLYALDGRRTRAPEP